MKAIITGACGFIGLNSAVALLRKGYSVVGIDNLSRVGTDENLKLLQKFGDSFTFIRADIRDVNAMMQAFSQNSDASVVIHCAAQVAVTTSVVDPRTDFETNALGTLNILEAVRAHCPKAAFLFSSTNKVYGKLDSATVLEEPTRYVYENHPLGISEESQLDFYSPYGCSKGSADQYVKDYARIYGLKTVVFRQSCIYGPHQFGMEDQGWVAWFIIATTLGHPITVYGDGKQVRDLLWIDDLTDLYIRAIDRIETCAGRVYNAGGGPINTLSLLELISELEVLQGRSVPYATSAWRPGDQKVFVADISLATRELGWSPVVRPTDGVKLLATWVEENQSLVSKVVKQNAAATS